MQRHHATPVSSDETAQSQGPEHAIHITHLAHSNPHRNATLLAQIPDMSFDEPDSFLEEGTASGDGRIISQALASKLVIGGGILLVLAAILPFVAPAKKTDSQANEPAWANSPVPDASVAPAWNGGAPQKAATSIAAMPSAPSIIVQAAPAGTASHAVAPATSPMTAPLSVAATKPLQMQQANVAAEIHPANSRIGQTAVEMNRPMAIRDRVDAVREQTVAAEARPAISPQRQGDYRQTEWQQGDYRQNELRANDSRPVDPRQNTLRANDSRQADYRQDNYRQADLRNDVGDRYRNDYRSDSRGDAAPKSPVMPDLNREFSPAGPQAPSSPPPPPEPPAGSAAPGPGLPSGGNSAGQLPPVPPEQSPQAGVARLQGVVGTPPTN